MSAGERLPGTPVPGHIWDGYELTSDDPHAQHDQNDQLFIDIYEHWLEPYAEE